MKLETALRWYSVVSLAIAGFVVGNFLEEAAGAVSTADRYPECTLPILSERVLPFAAWSGEFGAGFSLLVLLLSGLGFVIVKSPEIRMRIALLINIVGWPILLVLTIQFFLAAYVLPMAKCAT